MHEKGVMPTIGWGEKREEGKKNVSEK